MENIQNFDVTLTEKRKFAPSSEFQKNALYSKDEINAFYRLAKESPEKYWEEAAQDLTWFEPWKKTLEWDAPNAKWFIGGKLNAAYNCLDRHLEKNRNKTAIIWESEPGEVVSWTYSQLHTETERLTSALRKLGLKKGDRVAIYMPLVPEAVAAMLACARGGFVHTVVFGGFSAEALKDRINDAEASLVITADGGYRKGGWIKLKDQVDAALGSCPSVKNVISLRRSEVGKLGRNTAAQPVASSAHLPCHDWHTLLQTVSPAELKSLGTAESLDSEHPLYILYTSGTTGKPKGILHTTGGYMTGSLRTTKLVFDLKPEDLYWCTADIGWVTGHSYVVYGPLAAGATVFLYEGAPTTPTMDRFWEMIERHKITVFYTAPTAIRTFMRLGTEYPKKHDMSSLRLLGSVGEPINPEAWMWYRENIGSNHCPIVDTFWQTETGAIVVSPIPSFTETKPGSATRPLPGYAVEVVDKAGTPVPLGSGGYLVIQKPWPSMARTIYKDAERFKKQYFSDFTGGVYFTGDGARKDEDGYIWCLGRVDDVLNVSGHRLGTMEVESALVSHPAVAESAVVGRPDEIKGQAVVAFVTLKAEITKLAKDNETYLSKLRDELRSHVTKEIGALARPEEVRFTDALPKTRSGKIMRRLLRELATNGSVKGDTTTLEDFSVIASLKTDEE